MTKDVTTSLRELVEKATKAISEALDVHELVEPYLSFQPGSMADDDWQDCDALLRQTLFDLTGSYITNHGREMGADEAVYRQSVLARLSIGKGNGEVIPGPVTNADAACSLRETLVTEQVQHQGLPSDLQGDLVRCAEILCGLATWRRNSQEGRTFPTIENCDFARETLRRVAAARIGGGT